MQLTNINDLKVGQRIWWYGKYGDLMGGDKGAIVTKVEPKSYECDGFWYDSFSCDITQKEYVEYEYDYKEIPCKTKGVSKHICIGKRKVDRYETKTRHYGVSIQGNQIYSKKPLKDEFVSNEVEFESDCECGGTIYGSGFEDNSGEIVSFNYQECDSCGWNQAS